MIQRPGRGFDPPRPGGARPPVGERQLRTRRHDPIGRGQRQVGAHRHRGIRTARRHRVDDLGHTKALQHRPHRGEVPELFVLAAHRLTGAAPASLAITSSAVPKYSCDTIRGLPSTRADSTR